ncbi:sigma-54 interaction domain-containing protein [Persephonella sp.]
MRISPRTTFSKNIIIKCGHKLISAQSLDLSLYGMKIKNHPIDKSNEDSIEITFETNKVITLRGKIFYYMPGYSVVVFKENSETIASTVGKFITEKIYEKGVCPYCKENIKDKEKSCHRCNMFLDFTSPDIVEVLRDFKIGKAIEKLTKKEKEKIEKYLIEHKEMIGSSKTMKKVFQLIRKYAPTDYPVLIIGETGTGKELTAKAIHERSNRADKPFVVVNCAAIPHDLLEAELFGYEKGAFTGADKKRIGKIEYANGGTLFLDEIGDMIYDLQSKILRFLQEYTFERIGSNETRTANVRIITATNVDLEKAVKKGKFRRDLYYRLSVLTINLPPLREREEDAAIMAKYFVELYSRELGKNIKGLTTDAIEVIRDHPWPGNVRELINTIRKAVVLTDKEFIDVEDLNLNIKPYYKQEDGGDLLNLRKNIEGIEKRLLKEAFILAKGNVSKVASLLGISRPKVYKMMEKYGIGEISDLD